MPALVAASLCALLAVAFGFLAFRRVRSANNGALALVAGVISLLVLGHAGLRGAQSDAALVFWARWILACTIVLVPPLLLLSRAVTGRPSRRFLIAFLVAGAVLLAFAPTDLMLTTKIVPLGHFGIPRHPAPRLLFFVHYLYIGPALLLSSYFWIAEARKYGGRLPGGAGRIFPVLIAAVPSIVMIFWNILHAFDVVGRSFPFEFIAFGVVLAAATGLLEELTATHKDLEKENERVRALNEEIEARRRREAELAAENQKLLQEEISSLRYELDESRGATRLVGRSPAIERLDALIGKLAPLETTVLIVGETGTGKELVARELHERSPRAGKPFVAFNVAAMPENLLEAELFGHVKGAFTGATQSRPGVFERASEGTLFLDEIGEASAALQSKLLRVLQERLVTRVGGSEDIPVDVRVVAATHRDLEKLQREGKFREDLYYRLNVVRLDVPPLKERQEDVPLLAAHFLKKTSAQQGRELTGISRKALAALSAYPWPGNIRELQNVIERAVALSQGAQIRSEDLPAGVVGALTPGEGAAEEGEAADLVAAGAPPWLQLVGPEPELAVLERAYVLHVLELCEGNKTRAAERLGVNLRTLHRWLRAYE